MLESLVSSMGLWGILIIGLVMMLLIWLAAEIIKRFGPKADVQTDGWKQDYPALVTGKRSHGRTYYATFQNDQGERTELELPGEAYGLLAEGDKGIVSLVDGHFAGFARENQA